MMCIADTLLDISHESSLKKPEKVSLRRIAKKVRKLQAENKKLIEGQKAKIEAGS